jgi:6,7-dimethyl-8-ribityllumazine synthase
MKTHGPDASALRAEITAAGMSIQQVADAANLSYQRLWNKLHGRTALTEDDARSIRSVLSGNSVESRTHRGGRVLLGDMDAKGRRFVILVSRWNEFVTKELLEGAQDELRRHGDPIVDVVQVPGTWEMPIAAVRAAESAPDAIIALGCIMQGQTAHAGLLGGDVGSALMSIQVQTKVPIAWGVLTPEDQSQALDRAGLKMGNKGREAALAAIEMASLLTKI